MSDKKHGGVRSGAGRPTSKSDKKKPKTLNLDLDTHKGLDLLKAKTGKSQAVIVENLVKKEAKKHQ